ncbi:MAG: SHOCT domain-containing protein [Thermoleophilaceae bacterium]|nr:SHOCT domain-containing protein [Thermoleophilaceae bacterium]
MNVLLAASDSWSLGDALLLTIEIFLFVIWIWIFISIVVDLFRDHELGGVGKAIWLLFLIIIPFLSALVYLIVRGGGMRDRAIKEAVDIQKAQNEYIRQVAGSPVDDLAKLNDLKNSGVLSQEEFDKAKAKALAEHHGE